MNCPKVRYSSEQHAMFDVNRIQKRSTRSRVPIRAYKCKCGSWHITSKDDNLYDKIIIERERVDELLIEIKNYKDEIAGLKLENVKIAAGHRKKENVEIRADERVVEYARIIKSQKELIKKLRNYNKELCGKMARLQ